MKIISSSLPKSGSKSLISDVGHYFLNCIYLEAKVDRGFGNLCTTKLSRGLFKGLPFPTILYGHFPFCASLEETTKSADLVLVGLRPLSQLVFSYKRHINRTGYSPLDLRVGNFPDISLGWKLKTELEQLNFLLDWLIPYSAKFLLSWIWVRKHLHENVEFIFFEDIVNETFKESFSEQYKLKLNKQRFGFHYGKRSNNIFENKNNEIENESITFGVNEIIQTKKECYVKDFGSDDILFNYVFS